MRSSARPLVTGNYRFQMNSQKNPDSILDGTFDLKRIWYVRVPDPRGIVYSILREIEDPGAGRAVTMEFDPTRKATAPYETKWILRFFGAKWALVVQYGLGLES